MQAVSIRSIAPGLLALTMAVLGDAAQAQAASASFNVLARDNSVAATNNDIGPPAAAVNTGIGYALGAPISITASGSWNIGGGCPSFGPDGTNCFGEGLPGILYGSLIGKIGSAAWAGGAGWFKVGSSFSGAANNTGNLFLAFLDNDAANNSGFVTAFVTVVPEPATYALMASGLAVLIARRKRQRVPLK